MNDDTKSRTTDGLEVFSRLYARMAAPMRHARKLQKHHVASIKRAIRGGKPFRVIA